MTDRRLSRRAALGGVVGATLAGTVGCSPAPAPGPAASEGPSAATPTAPSPGSATPTASPSVSSSPSSSARAPRPRADAVLRTTGPDLVRGPATARVVALTFHGAGPVSLAEELLTLLGRASVPVTVFAVGTWLRDHHELGRAFTAAGHDLGNHTWSHQVMPRLGRAEADLEVARGAREVATVLGRPGLLFRPSGTPRSTTTIRAAARAAGYHRCISYDVDPGDYLDPGAAAVRDRTLAAVRPGSIVSLHLGHPGTVAALPGILRGLAHRRLEPVTVTTMFR